MGPTVFISYGHDEYAELALRLKADLEKLGFSPWLDQSEIKGGQQWEVSIEDGLKRTDCAFLRTPHCASYGANLPAAPVHQPAAVAGFSGLEAVR
jgi:hypothetical protein